jgi:hypothetical protein
MLGAFFNPKGLLASVLLDYARKYNFSMEELDLSY